MGFILFFKFWFGEGERVELYIHEEKKKKKFPTYPLKKGRFSIVIERWAPTKCVLLYMNPLISTPLKKKVLLL